MDTCFKLRVSNQAYAHRRVLYMLLLTFLLICWSRIKCIGPHFRIRRMAKVSDMSTRYGLDGSGFESR